MDIEPCPCSRCGTTPTVTVSYPPIPDRRFDYVVECDECRPDQAPEWGSSVPRAVAAWNSTHGVGE